MTVLVVTPSLHSVEPYPIGDGYAIVMGHFTVDTGDYVAGGFDVASTAALRLANLRLTTVNRIIFGGGNIVRTRAYYVKSTGKVKIFLEDVATGIEAEHAAAAMTAANYPFIAVGQLQA